MSTAPKLSDSAVAISRPHDSKLPKPSLLKVGTVALYVIFGIITGVQLFYLIKDEMMSTKLYTEMRRVPTMNMKPPLIASICVKPSHSQAELEKAGYSNYLKFYMGLVQNSANKALLSWSGYDETTFTDPSQFFMSFKSYK